MSADTSTSGQHSKSKDSNKRLDSWKEIAAYLKRSVRTVRRWEHQEGLPVQRHLHRKDVTIYAFAHEIDGWLESRRLAGQTKQPVRSPVNQSSRPSRPVVIAVLPLRNLSGDVEQERFAEGLTEELILEIGHCCPEALRVIASTSVMQYKQSAKNTQEIGRELNADYILEGGVRRYGRRVRLTSRLIAARDQASIWADSYEIQLAPIVSFQQILARKLAESISAQFHVTPRKSRSATTATIKAHDAFLKGRSHFLPTEADTKKCIENLFLAIKNDPTFAPSYMELALAYSRRFYLDYPPIETIGRIEEFALKALKLSPKEARAHTAFAVANLFGSRNWATAEKSSRRAIQLNPSCPWARITRAAYHVVLGEVEQATEQLNQARQLDPLSAEHGFWIAMLAYYARRYEFAIECCHELVRRDSSVEIGHRILALCYAQRGDYSDALEHIEKATEPGPGPFSGAASVKAVSASVYGLAGERDAAERRLQEMADEQETEYIRYMFMAQASVALGNAQQTIEWLEKALEQHDPLLVFVRADARFDPLTDIPEFRNLLRRIGLPTSPLRRGATSTAKKFHKDD